ncbi:MAG: aspartate-semialdehyde dehydrogenase [Oscillospiraceae bacterium]|nr:aspartate-semialdehyde dehydrogenase [Oscillospiraceae bacterium]
MKAVRIGILGATGAVGREMLRLIEEYALPVSELRLLASRRSAGERLPFRDGELHVEETTEQGFRGLNYVLGAVEAEQSRRWAPAIREAGAVYIDNSSAYRLDPAVPLVVPEVNGEDAFGHRGILANPNCSTVISLMAATPIHRLSPIESITASTYQAVSGAGQAGLQELQEQMRALAAGEELRARAFPVQIALNVIPAIGAFTENGYTDEEMKLQNEGRRILHAPELKVSCTCVRVPVLRSHAIALTLRTRERVEPEAAREAIRAFPGVRLAEDLAGRDYPTPLDSSGGDTVWVGRLREDLTDQRGICLWCCGDQLRKGAAANAVQILRLLAEGE